MDELFGADCRKPHPRRFTARREKAALGFFQSIAGLSTQSDEGQNSKDDDDCTDNVDDVIHDSPVAFNLFD